MKLQGAKLKKSLLKVAILSKIPLVRVFTKHESY
jgi:hypothetical protein